MKLQSYVLSKNIKLFCNNGFHWNSNVACKEG